MGEKVLFFLFLYWVPSILLEYEMAGKIPEITFPSVKLFAYNYIIHDQKIYTRLVKTIYGIRRRLHQWHTIYIKGCI